MTHTPRRTVTREQRATLLAVDSAALFHRRGQSDTALEWTAINLVMTFIVAIIVVALVSVYTNRDVSAAGIERGALLYRLVYDDLLAANDTSIGRVYPGIIDITKCDNTRLDAVFVEDRGTGPDGTPNAAQLSAMIDAAPSATTPACTLKQTTCYVHKDAFNLALAQSGMKNGASVESRLFPIALTDGKTTCSGTLNITIARLNT